MIVLDSSAAIELTLRLPKSGQVRDALEAVQWRVAAPPLLVIEVLQVLRRRVAAEVTSPDQADEARRLFGLLSIRYFDHQLLANRVWALRENLTAYDAAYIVLGEALGADVLTADRRMANSPGHSARILLVR